MEREIYQPIHIYEEERELVRRLIFTFIGGIFILNAVIANRIFLNRPEISGVSSLIGAILLGLPMLVGAFRGFSTGKLKLNELASIAVLACIALGYYVTAGVVAFILTLGHLLEHRTTLGAREAIESLLKLTPPTAHLVMGEGEKDIMVSELKKGDIIRVKPGENIPADGVIIKGETTINEASITGESLPVDKFEGDQVFEGTTNLTGVILVKVTETGKDTMLGKVKELILKAERTKIPIITLMEKYVQWYIPVILMVACLILFFTRDALRAISALIVGVPCALLLATPTAIIAVLSSSARSGIVIKEPSKIEITPKINAVIFDKTGTLTTGEPVVTSLNPVVEIPPEKFLYYVGTIEKHSLHPVAKAIRKLAEKVNIKLGEPENFEEIGGKGVKGKVENREVLVGRDTYLKENGIDVPEIKRDAGSVLHVAIDSRYYGWIGVEDQMRVEAKETTEALKKIGVEKLIMLTGDKKEIAEKVGKEFGFEEVIAECLPETKLEVVENLKRKGYQILMIGDGINDAPALAASDIGVAMGAMGSDVAINSASVALMSNDLRKIPFFLSISKLANGIIYQNIAIGGILVLLGLILSGAGIFNPVIAALYHEIGSIAVIFNSARLVKYE
ncbi:MAG TPA: cadmium-translocating P-type ATPase [bacterium]|nr:cadmium-translocating P-type ATPase [bacterium]